MQPHVAAARDDADRPFVDPRDESYRCPDDLVKHQVWIVLSLEPTSERAQLPGELVVELFLLDTCHETRL